MFLTELEKTHDPETISVYRGYARRFLRHFGNALMDVTTARMGDYQRDRLTQVTRASLKKERSFMNTFLSWCLEQGVLAEDRVPRWPHLPKRATGTRTGKGRAAPVDITPAQARAFVLALPLVSLRSRKGRHFPVRARFVFMAETGLRPATIDAIEVPKHWKPGQTDVLITPEINKARKRMVLPLTPRAAAALEAAYELGGGQSGIIFGAHDYRTVVEHARVAAGLPEDFVPYDLRHHFVSFMADAAEARAAMHLAMHTRLTTTNHYVRGQEDRAREAVSALGSRGILGEGDVPMSAKDPNRTGTGVTPLEPESSGVAQVTDISERTRAPKGTKDTPEAPSSWGSPRILGRAQEHLAALRAEWDAYDGLLLEELLGGGES